MAETNGDKRIVTLGIGVGFYRAAMLGVLGWIALTFIQMRDQVNHLTDVYALRLQVLEQRMDVSEKDRREIWNYVSGNHH